MNTTAAFSPLFSCLASCERTQCPGDCWTDRPENLGPQLQLVPPFNPHLHNFPEGTGWHVEGNLNCLSAPNGSMLKTPEGPSHSKVLLTRHLEYQLGEMGDYENASCRPPTPGKGTDQMPRLPHLETHLHICAKTTPPTGCSQPRMGRAWLLWLGHSQEMQSPLLSDSGSRTLS